MEKYDLSYLILLVQKAHTVFCYFNISREDIVKFEADFGEGSYAASWPQLKIYGLNDLTNVDGTTCDDRETSSLIQCIDIDRFANNWFIDLPDNSAKVFVKLCRVTSDNLCYEILTSNIAVLPSDHISEDSPSEFYNVKSGQLSSIPDMPRAVVSEIMDPDPASLTGQNCTISNFDFDSDFFYNCIRNTNFEDNCSS